MQADSTSDALAVAAVSGQPSPLSKHWPLLRATLVGALFVWLLTAPTLTRITAVGRIDSDDGRFSIWNVAWVARALLTNPSGWMNANIFWPHQGTLAYSELNLVAGVLGVPWYAITGNPVATFNGAIASALLLSFVCMWALVRRLTQSDGAGLFSAVAFTFCPFVTAVTAQAQLLMVFVFPLVFLAFHRLLERPGPWRGVELGAAVAIAGLSCGYYGIFAGCALALMALTYLTRAGTRYLGAIGIAMVTAAALVFPVFRAFSAARRATGARIDQHQGELAGWSANVSSYFASSAAAHDWWLPYLLRWEKWVDPMFPGIATLVFAGVALVSLRRASWERGTIWRYAAIAVAACWASFGPAGHLYTWLQAVMPPMSLLRAPVRFGVVVTFALVVVAGFGVAALERRSRTLAALLVVLVAAELAVKTDWGWPSWPLRRVPELSSAYRTLAALPRGVFVEYPFPYERANYHSHGAAMFWSTYHWQPMVNGYSDVIPPDFDQIALPINYFPDPQSFAIMKDRQVRYVLWHVDTYDPASRQVLEARLARYTAELKPIVRTPGEWLYEIVQWP